MKKPLMAVTMGDPLGIGPEIIVASWVNPQVQAACRYVVYGRASVMRRAVKLLNLDLDVPPISDVASIPDADRQLPVYEIEGPIFDEISAGRVDPIAGRLAHDCIVKAAQDALSGKVAAVLTAPIHKASLAAAGCQYIGHTELLASVTGVHDEAMMLYLPPSQKLPRHEVGFGVVHTTLHLALRDIFEYLTVERIVSRCRLVADFFQRLLAARRLGRAPRVAVAALNPHGGEAGLFGREEVEIIRPAVEEAQRQGLPVAGPFPVDTLMARAIEGEYDAVVAMYHDQGHIALKLLGMRDAVNVTLGLPIVRVSAAHGTAFEIAWQGRADCSSMVQAALVAAQWVQHVERT